METTIEELKFGRARLERKKCGVSVSMAAGASQILHTRV